MIEVEKKFQLKPGDEARLTQSAQFVKEVTNTDTYWDTDDYRLSCADTWLRQRNGKWELKIPLHAFGHGNHVVEQYHEIETDEGIREKIGVTGTGTFEEDVRAMGFAPFATIVTTRRKYTDGVFHIDLDSADYGYALCEIEYMVPDDGDTEAAARMVMEFAASRGLTLDNAVHGKLLEYIRRFRPEQYARMEAAGVLWQTNKT